jgi:hypothetical protein
LEREGFLFPPSLFKRRGQGMSSGKYICKKESSILQRQLVENCAKDPHGVNSHSGMRSGTEKYWGRNSFVNSPYFLSIWVKILSLLQISIATRTD